jgi:hypothetical protein
MKENEWMDARELKKFVRQSAQKKKSVEEQAKRQTRDTSIETASVKREELEKALQRPRRDYSALIGFLAVAGLVVGISFLAFRAWQSYRLVHRPAWEQPTVSTDDLLGVEEYVRQIILKAERSRLTDVDFQPGTPPYWQEKAQRVLKELAQGKGVIEEVYIDEQQLGKDPRYLVDCRGSGGNAQIVIGGKDKAFRIIKINKSW